MSHQSGINDFTRGGQIFMHSLRMFGQASKYLIKVISLLFIILLIWVTTLKTNPYDRYLFYKFASAEFNLLISGKSARIDIYNFQSKNRQTKPVKLYAKSFVKHPRTQLAIKHCIRGFGTALYLTFASCVAILFSFVYFFKFKGRSQRKTTELRGGSLTDPKTLTKLLKKANKASDICIAGVPLVKNSEVQHILLTGTTGTGKSVCMKEIMDQVRAKGQRAIVYDIEGTFIPKYFRPGIDTILNPLDPRCPAWNIWQECQDSADFEAVASSLMPLHLAGSDPFWIHSARTIFASAALKLDKDNKRNNQALLQPLFSENLAGIGELLAGSPAESLISEKNEKTALSIKATLSTYCKALMYLKDDTKGPLFSIRKWVETDEGDGWLFIASNAQKIDALKPLISVWLDVAAKSILSLSQSAERRLWFFIDELPSLHRLPSLVNTLSRCRKYGGCFVGAIQDVHQLHSVYGRDEAETLTALFNTNLCYRTKGPDSAVWMSKVMGSREIIEKKEGYSYGANDMRDGVSINQERRKETIVIDSEFIQLDDLEAYLRLSGDWPVAKVKFEVKEQNDINSVVLPRELQATKRGPILDILPFQSLEEAENPIRNAIKAKRVNVEEAQ